MQPSALVMDIRPEDFFNAAAAAAAGGGVDPTNGSGALKMVMFER